MCGLAGCFTSSDTTLNKGRRLQRARVLEGLLVANQTRGTDSTGVAAINLNGEYALTKYAVEAEKFVDLKSARQTLRLDAPIMIGHTRMSSMGWNDVTDENAHPFVEGNIIGAHNGIINNYTDIDNTVNVDSQAVLRLLNEHEFSYDYAFKKVRGSCALTWWDARDPEAMFIVAHENPLSIAIVPDIGTVYWSSQAEHLEPIMRAAYGNKVFMMTVARDTIYRFDADDPFAWQEQPVDFMPYNYQTQGRGFYERDGWTGAIVDRGPAVISMDDDDEDDGAGKVIALPTTTVYPEDDEERYDEYWGRMMGDDSLNRNEESCDVSNAERLDANVRPLHSLSDGEFMRTEIDALDDDLTCQYCGNSLIDNVGVFDDGIGMLLCKPCLNWWDNFGSKTASGAVPEATA